MAHPARLALFAILLTAVPGSAPAQQEPADTGYRETVQVDLAQIEVTVWPKSGDDAEACRGLADEDFELTVNGRAREISAVDWLGSPEIMQAIEGVPVEDPVRPPLTVVLFFDLWHLNKFYRDFDCPMTKPLAFDEARKLVREEFRSGDRLLLVTFAGWPQIHGDWIREPALALRALDRLEVSPFVQNAQQIHQHHQSWMDGMKSLLLALGRYPGRKEVFYLGDDFPFDDVEMQMYSLAARAQANQVSIHAVDLIWSCRGLPGLGCADMERGGLACTPFGCRDEAPGFVDGRLIKLDGDEVVPVPIEWFDAPDAVTETGEMCGWLAGRIVPELSPGLWLFEPPASRNGDPARAGTLEFRVMPGASDGAYLRARPTSSALHIGL